ncbi:MAG: hypothetical protein BGP24_09005 [Lysobacterales bacterium 69-70]|nr:MAG: hypothetical protein ABS97_12030 [Xanthomonadaceae bacterium SCN 69-320]ODV20571.1 MAG: hypothetical protein ABT27_07650 [Xanthomonadaceae bacterium SCN 69-25]OJZ00647.1 MAG: hypothetical protein BGP24_09005 [Xanthomonadales bacterium 69-70]
MTAPHENRRTNRTIPLASTRAQAGPAAAPPQADDLVELDLGEGIALFTGGRDLDEQLVHDAAAGRDGSIDLAAARSVTLRSAQPAQRGAVDFLVRALKVIDVDLGDWLAPVKNAAKDLIGAEIARRIDTRDVAGRSEPGLWQCDEKGPYARPGFDRTVGHPALLLLHGFFSNTAGSFDGLWKADGGSTLDLLSKHYQGAIYGFDHATLGESPARNALRLVQALGEGQELHLLGYSRGCLVGELLSRAQSDGGFSDGELRRYETTHPEDAAVLRELYRTTRDKRIRVSRFVRVAGPLRGTWLASNRLDRWLSILYNLARLALPAGPQQIADQVFDLIAAVVKERLERRHFPGIEAMRPDGALSALLNDAPPLLQQRLTVIAGDCVGHGIAGRLKNLITDGFFGEPHDIVVPTASMFGGAPRQDGLRYFFHKTEQVDHFHYFRVPESLRRIQIGLIAEDTEYQRLQRLDRPGARPVLTPNRTSRPKPDAPLDIVLPGIMGSGLAYSQNDRLWVDFGEFALGKFSRLELSPAEQTQPYPEPGSAAIYPYRALDFWPVNFYGHLLDALERRGDLVEAWGFDWRKPLSLAADTLAEQLTKLWPEDSPRPLRFIAHSMGGLVVRLLFARHPGLLARFRRSARNRVLMLGTPNAGSLAVARTLLGTNDLIDKLDCIAPQNKTELLSVGGTFPGFFELLPQSGPDWGKPATWNWLFEQHRVPVAQRPRLDGHALALGVKGRDDLRAALAALPKAQCIYVAGYVPESAADATIVDLDADGQYVRGPGDGTVSYASGLIDGVDTYYVDAAHGDLPGHKKAFEAYFELLDAGRTTRLKRRWQDLGDTRGSVPLSLLPTEQLPYRPSRADIVRAFLGVRSRGEDEPEPSQPIVLRVVHGGLRFARYPIVVGHYQGDTMRASEAELDQLYDGQLRTALDLGVYPGPLETFQVFKRQQITVDRRSPYAVIIGLGPPGELSVGELRRTVRRGLLGWFGTTLSDLTPEQRESAFSVVLLGSSVSGMTVTECLRAILLGALDAQKVLAAQPAPENPALVRPRIRELEIIEIYEDKALELASELPVLIDGSEFQHRFLAPTPPMESRNDSLRRLRDGSRSISSVRRLDIRALSGGRLRFALPGIQAAVPLYKRTIDIDEVRTYARKIDRQQSTDATLGRVLFQQLLPLELKRFALEQYDLLLTLNESAASLPWELADAGGDLPLSVRAGMMRQLRRRGYTARERVAQNTALVVGRWDVPGLPYLDGARHEAEAVSEALTEAGFEVNYLPNFDALKIRDELGKRPYRIIHFAGHGVVDYRSPLADKDAPVRTGMVIGSLPVKEPSGSAEDPADGGERHLLLLTPEDVRECVDVVPELVFINCCHLGREVGIALDAPRLASNLANVFMDIGCRAVVAAGWAVDDDAAQCFSREFYAALVDRGMIYIDAVRAARALTYRLHGERTTTWGAYQCYGDVRYAARRGEAPDGPARFISANELACSLDALAVSAMGASPQRTRQIAARIARDLRNHADLLGDEGCCLAAVKALEHVGDYEPALALIEQRIAAQKSLPPILWRTHARLALRAAPDRLRDGNETLRKQAIDRCEESMRRLRAFADVERGATTWFALGTNYRRLFQLRCGGDVASALAALNGMIEGVFRGLSCVACLRGDNVDLETLSTEHLQKALGALIVGDGLGKVDLQADLLRLYDALNRSYAAAVGICRERLKTREAAHEFWDDVDSADQRLLLLVSPRETTLEDPAAYLAEARRIAVEYRSAMAVTATAAERETIGTYNRFWYEFAGFCLTRAPTERHAHWRQLRQAMEEAALPGMPPPPPDTDAAATGAAAATPAAAAPRTAAASRRGQAATGTPPARGKSAAPARRRPAAKKSGPRGDSTER